MTIQLRLYTVARKDPLVIPEEPWMQDALCREVGVEAFYSPPDDGGLGVRQAKRICRRCEVSDDCLRFALDHGEEHGVWGGLSPRERMRIERGLNKFGHYVGCICGVCAKAVPA